jgi:hypothetical protein
LTAAAFQWVFGADLNAALIDPAVVFGFADHGQGLPFGTGEGVAGIIIAKVGLDQCPTYRAYNGTFEASVGFDSAQPTAVLFRSKRQASF